MADEPVPLATSSGTLASTDSPDSSAITNILPVTGTLVATGPSDISRLVEDAIGVLTPTEPTDGAVIAGWGAGTGTLTATGSPDGAAFMYSPPATGTLAATGPLDTAAFATYASGVLTTQERGDTAVIIGTTPGAVLNLPGGYITARTYASAGLLQLTQLPVLLSGTITARSAIQLDTAAYATYLTGRITATSMLQGVAQPWQPVLIGTITAAAQLSAFAEIQVPPPPYPPPFLTYEDTDYLNRITSEHNQKPKYMATVQDTLDPVVQDQQLVAGIWALFDLDYCVGEQEDFTGQWIGKSRWIEIPSPFFSWDTQGLGWNQANWKGPADADDALERLDDYHYRLLLYAQVIANHWNGSIPAAYEAWDTLFQYTGIKVVIQDYGDMTMLYGFISSTPPDVILLSLFTTGQMDLRPEGVELRAYALQPEPGAPFFAWDAASDAVHGWDTGSWGIMVPPGSYVP